MIKVIICEHMKWDYYTYQKQPREFIELLKLKLELENEYGKLKAKSNNNS